MDSKFKEVLLRKYTHLFNNNSELISSECEKVETLRLENEDLNSIEGIGVFTNLKELYCHNNKLTTLNVQGLENLQWLYCYNNRITSLNVQGLDNLQTLSCGNNQLTTLNVQGLENLQELYCYDNRITSLDVQGLTNLQKLYCDRNVKLDVPFVFNTSDYCAFQAADGSVRCGCFNGSIEEFIGAVLDKYDQNCPYYKWAILL